MQRPADQNLSLDVHTLEFLRRFNAHLPVFTDNAIDPDRGDIAEALAGISSAEHLKPSRQAAAAFMNQFAIECRGGTQIPVPSERSVVRERAPR